MKHLQKTRPFLPVCSSECAAGSGATGPQPTLCHTDPGAQETPWQACTVLLGEQSQTGAE